MHRRILRSTTTPVERAQKISLSPRMQLPKVQEPEFLHNARKSNDLRARRTTIAIRQ